MTSRPPLDPQTTKCDLLPLSPPAWKPIWPMMGTLTGSHLAYTITEVAHSPHGPNGLNIIMMIIYMISLITLAYDGNSLHTPSLHTHTHIHYLLMGSRTSELSSGRRGARAKEGKQRRCSVSSSVASTAISSVWVLAMSRSLRLVMMDRIFWNRVTFHPTKQHRSRFNTSMSTSSWWVPGRVCPCHYWHRGTLQNNVLYYYTKSTVF